MSALEAEVRASGGPRQPANEPDNKDGVQPVVEDGQVQSPKTYGPLSALRTNPYLANTSLRYPQDLGTTRFPHFLRFNVNIPAKSSFRTTFTGDGVGTTDANRQFMDTIGFGGIGSGSDPFQGSAVAGGVIAGALVGAEKFLEGLSEDAAGLGGKTGRGLGALANAARQNVFGAALTGTVAGSIGATVMANIDMTRKTKRLQQTIDLYIPDQVIQQNQNKYGEVSLTAALGKAGLATQGAATVGGSVADTLRTFRDNIGSGNQVVGKGAQQSPVGAYLADALGQVLGGAGKAMGLFGEGIENVFLQSYGLAQNPQVEVLFETVDNRTFEFNFSFHPRNEKEAAEVIKIIRAFRFHAAPEIAKGTGGRYFIPPSEFDIEYMFVKEDGGSAVANEALHKFATCVLESIDVNYVGQSGQFVTFKDGIPVNIELRLRFKEVEIIHKALVQAGY